MAACGCQTIIAAQKNVTEIGFRSNPTHQEGTKWRITSRLKVWVGAKVLELAPARTGLIA